MDYKANDPRGWCGDPSRGAAMGRPTVKGPSDFNGEITVRRMGLDSGGYAKNGTYFGIGEPLYWYSDEEGDIDDMLRARGPEAALAAVRAEYPAATVTMPSEASEDDIDTMVESHAETALWSTSRCDEDGNDLGNFDNEYSTSDIAEETAKSLRSDCENFLEYVRETDPAAYAELLTDMVQAGHDFWLTREGHGAGFWDGDWAHGDSLTKASKTFGGVDLYVGEDGKIHGQ